MITETKRETRWGVVDGKIYRRHFRLLCLEYTVTVERQRPNLSSPDCLQTLHRQKPELLSTERTGSAETRLLASHLKAAEKPWTRGLGWGWEWWLERVLVTGARRGEIGGVWGCGREGGGDKSLG